MVIWGNHSSTQYPDIRFAEVNGGTVAGDVDTDWYRDTFIPDVQQRGAAIIKARGASSAASAASAAIDHMTSWALGTPEGDWVSMSVPSDGSYGIEPGIIYSYPCVCENGDYRIVQGLEIDAFSQERMDATEAELREERAAVEDLLWSMGIASAGLKLRQAVAEHAPLQVVGTINAFTARMAQRIGHKAIYLSGGGVAANSLGLPDLGISTLDDVLTDVDRITHACDLPLLVDADTGFGGAFNIARTVRSLTRAGAAGMHIEDQVAAKRCGHRPGKAIVSQAEMVDRVKAAVDARSDENFVIMARTDALAVEGMASAIDRAVACVEAGADMIFPEAMRELAQYAEFKQAVGVPILANITEFGQYASVHHPRARGGRRRHRALLLRRLPGDEPRRRNRLPGVDRGRAPEKRDRHHADPGRVVRPSRIPRIRAEAGRAVRGFRRGSN